MQRPLVLTLELTRAREAEDPYAFRPRTQEYILRVGRGVYRTVTLGWKEGLLDDLMALRQLEVDPKVAQRLGGRLRDFLVEGGWEVAENEIREAVEAGRPVHITLLSAAAELYALPWELLTLAPTGERLAQLPGVLLQYEWPGTRVARRTAPEDRPNRVLFAWSAAADAVPAGEHQEALEAAIAPILDQGGQAEVVVLANATRLALTEALEDAEDRNQPFRYLHILCHGSVRDGASGLILDGSAGPEFVDPNELQAVIGPFAGTLDAVVLCACHGGDGGDLDNQLGSVAQALHRGRIGTGGIPAVLSSRTFMKVEAASLLTRSFYAELFGRSGNLEEAFLKARRSIERRIDGVEYAWLQLYRHGAPTPEDAAGAPAAEGRTAGLLSQMKRSVATATAVLQVDHGEAHRALPVVVTAFRGERAAQSELDVAPAMRLVVEGALNQAGLLHGLDRTQIWSVHAPKGVQEPELLGLAAAMASFAACTERELPAGWAFIGGFGQNGAPLVPAELDKRLEAAQGAGLSQVALLAPAGTAPPTRAGLRVITGDSLVVLARQVWPSRARRTLAAASALLALSPVLALLQVTAPLDLVLQDRILQTVNGSLPARNTVIVPARLEDLGSPSDRRADYPRLIEHLVDQGVASIGFDIAFTNANEADEAFAAAIERARAAGVDVAVGVRWKGGEAKPPGTEALAKAITPALVRFETEGGERVHLGRAVARKELADGNTLWNLGVLGLHGRSRLAGEPAVGPEGLALNGAVHPLDLGRLYLHPAERSPQYDFFAADGPEEMVLSSKVALVGSLTEDDDFLTPAGWRYGVELHAAMVETLAAGRVPVRTGGGHNGLLAVLFAAGATATTALIRHRIYRWVGLLFPIAAVAWVLVRASVGVVTDLSPLLLAGLAGVGWGVAWQAWQRERL